MSTPLASGLEWLRANASRFAGEVRFDEPLSKHTYYRIGGPAAALVVPKGRADLALLAEGMRAASGEVSFFLLGLGSNLLVSDDGYRGMVVKTGRIDLSIEAETAGPGRARLRTGASVAISSLLRRAAQDGWGGLEFLTGVPGSVGGAVAMNAGTHLGETKDALRRVTAFQLSGTETESERAYEGGELRFEYRRNLFLPPGALVVGAEWDVRLDEPARVKALIDETLARRKATQPIDFPSCGSVFKNPRAHGLHAWQVLDRLGLRGHRVGGAQISEKHSNFIVNLGGAKAADVRALIDLAKQRAHDELNIDLEEEVKYLGYSRS